MKKRTFLLIAIVTLATSLLVFTAGILSLFISSKDAVRERLTSETNLAASLIRDSGDFSHLDAYKTTSDFRITIIDDDGVVLYDTNVDGKMENHARREEYIAAMQGSPKVVGRYSATLGTNMNYYAVKTTLTDGQTVVIRLAVHSNMLTRYISVSLPVFILLLLITLGFSFAASERIAAKTADKIKDVNASIKSLADGNYSPVKADSRDTELYYVINNINEVNERISRHISREEDQRKLFGSVLNSVSQGIIAVNPEKEAVFINKSALAMFGADKQKYTAFAKKDLIYYIDDYVLYGKIVDHINENYSFEYAIGNRDCIISIKKAESLIMGDDEVSIIVISDVSEQKSVAREKSDFFANASHELKTPVTVIQGLTELLLQRQSLDDATRKKLNTVHSECLRLTSIIADMMKLSGLERPLAEEKRELVDLRAVADEIAAELSAKTEEKNLTVSVSGQGSVLISPKNAFELVGNLFSNAVNYNLENGSIAVDVRQTDDKIVLTVSDTGIGIEEQHVPRLCERFYRVDKSRSKKTGGTGLGLAIVKHVCLNNDATLNISSQFGVGTTVTVTFDLPEKSTACDND